MKIKKLISREKAYLEWKYLLKKNNVKIKNIKYKSIIKRNNCDFSISTVDSNLIYKGKTYERVVQLEGASVVIIPLLYYKKKIKTLLVSQFRAPLAGNNFEFPSGSADYKNLKKSAQKEINEELGIKIDLRNLKKINRKGIFVSANNYSKLYYFYFKIKVDKKMLNNFKKNIYGNKSHGEYIKLKLVDFNKFLNNFSSANITVGYSLIKNYEIL
ncbi:MAG: hypothetical protein ACJZ4H_01235 [Candidatus Pelagibacter sp.]